MTRVAAEEADAVAPDGMEVRLLASCASGSMAHFRLEPRQTARAVAHKTVEELWYFLEGRGRMWRRHGRIEETLEVEAGVSISIPLGTSFQLRCESEEPLVAVAVTMPPWPGDDEAFGVDGLWSETI